MRAAAFDRFGTPDVLALIDIEPPQAAPDEIRVRVRAAGVSPMDCYLRRGWVPPVATVMLPQIPGTDFAGVIDEIGAKASGFTVGDEVLGFRPALGCNAQYVVVRPNQIVAKPAAMPWEIAGGLSAAGQVAHTALEDLRVSTGDTLLVLGANGAVGRIVVQLARSAGATVLGTGSAATHDALRALGVTPIAHGYGQDPRDGLAERIRAVARAGVDRILDCIGGETLAVCSPLTRTPGCIVTVAEHEDPERFGARFVFSRHSTARLQELVEHWKAGALRIDIAARYPIERAADAHRLREAGGVHGKIVLTFD